MVRTEYGKIFAIQEHDLDSGLVYAMRTIGYQATVWHTYDGYMMPSSGRDFKTYDEAQLWLKNQKVKEK